jgi:small basic protein
VNGPLETYVGIKLSAVLAGLIGGIVSLSFIRNLTPLKAVFATLTGAASAAYTTPLIVSGFDFGHELENAIAFLTGLLGMNVLAGIFKISERFQQKPLETLRDIKNLKGPNDD